jgi:hypothetical protein
MSISLDGMNLADLKERIGLGLDLKGILGDTPVLVFRPHGKALLFQTPVDGEDEGEPLAFADATSVFDRKTLQTAVYAEPDSFVVPLTPTNRNLYDDQVLVGRGRQNDIRLLSTDVSKSHASFSKGEDGWTVTDLGSCNGTSVNATPLEADRPYRLRPSDELVIADVAAVFLDPQGLVALTTMVP